MRNHPCWITSSLLPLLLILLSTPAFAQVDFSGEWAIFPKSAMAIHGFVVTTVVEDPQYLLEPFVTSTNFKKQPDATGWDPKPCSAR